MLSRSKEPEEKEKSRGNLAPSFFLPVDMGRAIKHFFDCFDRFYETPEEIWSAFDALREKIQTQSKDTAQREGRAKQRA